MHKIRRYFAGVYKQAKIVRWPSRKEMVVYVGIVLLFVAISAAALAIDDFLIAKLLNSLDEALAPAVQETEEATEVIKIIDTIGGLM